MLPTDPRKRKETPIARGVLDYFPDAVAEVARVSHAATQQHHPGEEMHWDKGKSSDHDDCLVRHLLERGTIDTDGQRHSAKVAWRALALLQTEIDAETPPSPPNPNTKDVDHFSQYRENGCPAEIATLIEQGTISTIGFKNKKHVYIAGPMRGYVNFNFPAFDEAAKRFRSSGWVTINPADIDRAAKDVDMDNPDAADTVESQRRFILRDFHALYGLNAETDAIAMLPGWERSTGAVAEFFLARWLKIKILDATTMRLLLEADGLSLIQITQSFLRNQ